MMKRSGKKKEDGVSYPKRQLEYLDQVTAHYSLSLKHRCFITITNHVFQHHLKYGKIPANDSLIASLVLLPLELKEELIHFMLEYRLFIGTKFTHEIPTIQWLFDSRIRSIDFSVVKSKVSQNDTIKEWLKVCHYVTKLDFSYCYEISDSIIKVIIHSLQNYNIADNNNNINNNNLNNNLNNNNNSNNNIPISASTTNLDDMMAFDTLQSPKKSKIATLRRFKDKIMGGKKKQQLQLQQQQQPDQTNINNNLNFEEYNQNNESNPTTTTSTTATLATSGNSNNNSNNNLTNQFEEARRTTGLEFLSLRQCTSFSSESLLRKLIRCSPNLTHLDLTGCSKITAKTLEVVTTTCLNLRTLAIGTLELTSPTVSIIPTFCNLVNLTALDISFMKLNHEMLEGILSIHQHSIIVNSNGYSPNGSSPIGGSVNNSTININGNQGNSGSNSNNNSSNSLGSNYQQSPSLKGFNLAYSITSARKSGVILPHTLSTLSISSSSSSSTTTTNVKSLSEEHTIHNYNHNNLGSNNGTPMAYPGMLQSLNMAQTEIDDDSLDLISQKCPMLHSLDISFCSKISDQGLIDMCNNGLSTLTSLACRLTKLSHGLVEVIKHNRLLTRLDIRFTQMEDTHLQSLAALTTLHVLRVDGSNISDGVFRAIANSNNRLEKVSLSQCKNITVEIFDILANSLGISLKKLYIPHSRLTGANISMPSNGSGGNLYAVLDKFNGFFNQCINLKSLDIQFTPLINDHIIGLLTRSSCAPQLETLLMGGGFHNLSDDVVRRLIIACPNIRVFSSISCYNIKDSTILLALKYWLLLEAIELTDCTALTSTIIQHIVSETHCHFHLRFVFYGSSINKESIDEYSIMSKLEGKSTLELLETQQQITLEDLIEQGFLLL